MRPKVSIIVPIYGVEKYLDRCMKTLLEQSLQEIEIIMVDDESPDSCPQKCDYYNSLDTRIKVIHKKNQGLGFARNSGLDIAKGEFVAFVDSDDYVDKDMFRLLYSYALEKNADTVIAGFNKVSPKHTVVEIKECNQIERFQGKKELHNYVMGMLGSEPECENVMLREMSVWRGIYSMDLINANKIRFCSERQFISEDIIFHLDYFEQSNKLLVLPEALYYYCENSASLTKKYKADRFEKNCILYKEIKKKLKEYQYPEKAYEYAMKMFLVRARSSVYQAVAAEDILGIKSVRTEILSITKAPMFRKVVQTYPIKRLPKQKRLFLELMKLNASVLLYLLIKIKNSVGKV